MTSIRARFVGRYPRSLFERSLGLGSNAFSLFVILALLTDGALYAQSNYATPYAFTTLAGSAGEGSADGSGSVARFNSPTGLAVDTAGNIYVADTVNQTIRKVTPAGSVTTLAGSGFNGSSSYFPGGDSYGSSDGVGTAATFYFPKGVAVDGAGTVYVADSGNSTIRKITADGMVTTLAGRAGAPGWDDGTGSAARFFDPTGVAADGAGNVYVADRIYHTIRKITAAGVVTTFAGAEAHTGSIDGVGRAASFSLPNGVAADGAGNLYVADTYASVIRKINAAGEVTTLAGSRYAPGFNDGAGAAARFNNPNGLAVDAAGYVYVADTENQTIRKITPAGVVTTIAGTVNISSAKDGTGSAAQFYYPRGIAVDSAGHIYVADTGNNMIRKGSLLSDGSPQITIQPSNQAITGGSACAFSIAAIGMPAPTFRWQISTNSGASWTDLTDGGNYSGTRTASLGIANVGVSMNGYSYRCAASNTVGNITSIAATLNVTAVPPTSTATRLINISARGYCSSGDRVIIGGFVVNGSGPKRVLIRAVGPSLANQGLSATEVLADPTVEVHQGQPVIASNDNWSDNANAAELATVGTLIGANPLAAGDAKSSALLLTLEPGVYSFVASGKAGASGVVLLEVFDADSTVTDSSFVNISTRAYSTTGNGVTIGGFVVSGNSSKQLLLRAVGSTLSSQGIAAADVLTDPTIELHDASHHNITIASNDDWVSNTNASSIVTVGARIGAAPFQSTDTKSAALLVTVSPGVYSFIASGKSASSGIVLVEVYDAD